MSVEVDHFELVSIIVFDEVLLDGAKISVE